MRTVCCSGCLGGCLPRREGCLPGGCTPPPLWTEFLTHACENITFPQLLLRTVMNDTMNAKLGFPMRCRVGSQSLSVDVA